MSSPTQIRYFWRPRSCCSGPSHRGASEDSIGITVQRAEGTPIDLERLPRIGYSEYSDRRRAVWHRLHQSGERRRKALEGEQLKMPSKQQR
ncbi:MULTISPECIES: hypothetical protein [unclassified Bradyrhizobium]|uniref:hypothetical protein n=1 Tax=unclassified Bradyrhizobium TaxID=2631580 RepID=UPI002915F824|nr:MULTISPECIES: hypothetical protein [unclassified Bradyrhizobium]